MINFALGFLLAIVLMAISGFLLMWLDGRAWEHELNAAFDKNQPARSETGKETK